jgi:lipopolysaccharide/colanic/teichoic acid biosynthesis glycosyltransferase
VSPQPPATARARPAFGPEVRVARPALPAPRERAEPGRLGRALERGAALLLFGLALPVLVLLVSIVWWVDGRPLFYRGERLGLRKRPFVLYKVRTLQRAAAQVTAERLLEARDGLEIPGGRFLRDSRLDELPQLWNIVRGEMSFVGPRPERERISRIHCQTLPGYARRFAVRPGLFGPSQLFTPHSTPKRIRAWLDNAWSRRRSSGLEPFRLLVCTLAAALHRTLQLGHQEWSARWRAARAGARRERRRLRRARPAAAAALVLPQSEPGPAVSGTLLDIGEDAVRVRVRRAVAPGVRVLLGLAVELRPRAGVPRLRQALCTAMVSRVRSHGDGVDLVLAYEPCSEGARYVVHQYFLRDALAPPRRGARRRSLPTRRLLAGVLPALLRLQRRLGARLPARTPVPVGTGGEAAWT